MENVLKKVMIIRSGECNEVNEEENMKISGVGIRQMKFLLYYPLDKYIKRGNKIILVSSADICSTESAQILSEGLGIECENTSLLLNRNNYDNSQKNSIVLNYIKEKVIEKNADVIIVIVPYLEYSNSLTKEICEYMGKTFSMPPLEKGKMIILDLERRLVPEIY